MLAIGEGTVRGLRVVQLFFRAVLHSDDAIEGLEAAPQLQVDFTLDVHKDEAACETYGHNDQLGPEGPLEHTCGWTHKHAEAVSRPTVCAPDHDGW